MRPTFQGTVLAMLTATLLCGAAYAEPVKDATALTLPGSKDAPGAKNPAEAAALNAAGLPTDVGSAVERAQLQRKMGDLAGAAKTLSQIVLVAPDDPRVLGEYGKTMVAQGRSDDALAFLERAMELQPSDWSLYSAQGVAYDQKGDFRAAQVAYGRALALKPGEPTVLSNDALSHVQAGDLDEAEKMLTQAAQKGGDYPRISSNLALVQSLKQTQAAKPVQPVKAAVQAPTPVQAPVAPVAVATPKPAPKPVSPTPAAAAPVERAALPAPSNPAQATLPKPQGQAQAQATQMKSVPAGVEALKADPTVRMQAIPKDPKAGPEAKKVAAAKAKKPVKTAGDMEAALRPALSEAVPNQQANAGK